MNLESIKEILNQEVKISLTEYFIQYSLLIFAAVFLQSIHEAYYTNTITFVTILVFSCIFTFAFWFRIWKCFIPQFDKIKKIED